LSRTAAGAGDTSASAAPLGVELRHLRYFLAVFDERHFGHAAEQLHISQPPVSRAIRQLENAVGVDLLERTGHGVIPTPAGETLADGARRILASLDLLVAETQRAGGTTSTLRIGCLEIVPIERVQRFLEMLRAREPALDLALTHLPSREQIRRLRDRELDLAIVVDGGDHQGIVTHPLFPGEPLEAVLPSEHELAGRPALTPGDLREEVLVTGPRSLNPGVYDRFMTAIAEAGYGFDRVDERGEPNPRDLVLAVVSGDGVLLRPPSFKPVDEAEVEVVEITLDPQPVMPPTVAAWRANPPAELRRVLGVVREIGDELGSQ
jgi:DNA-binding transcriptional LysR family regulator